MKTPIVHTTCQPRTQPRGCGISIRSSRSKCVAWITLFFAFVLHNSESFMPASIKFRTRRRNEPFQRIAVSLFSEDHGSFGTKTPSKSKLHESPALEPSSDLKIEKPNTGNEKQSGMSLGRMSSFGALFSIGVVAVLALNNDPSDNVGVSEVGFVEGQVSAIVTNVMNAALPRSATDVISVSLGEGIAGAIGAAATVAVTFLLKMPKTSLVMEQRSFVEEAVADGDYFFTRAAALPLLEAAGLPPIAATLASVAVALVPYEIIKNRYKQQRKVERVTSSDIAKGDTATSELPVLQAAVKAKAETLPDQPQQSDLVEVFSDITKWLEYDVLKRDFGGHLLWNGQAINSGIEGAFFGFLSALSSKLYADTLYKYFGFGPESKRKEVQEKSMTASLSSYVAESLSAASLFGVYESVRSPVSQAVSALLSGGVDNCLGSDDFRLCMEVYVQSNPSEATWEGQLRSLLTALYSLWNRFESEAAVESTDELVRALVVQTYSVANNFLGLELVY